MRHDATPKKPARFVRTAFGFLLLAYVGCPWPCQAQEAVPTFTLESSIEHALTHSTQMLSAKEGVSAAEANKKKQFTEFLPKLSASYAYTRLDEEKTPFLGVVTSPQDLYQFTASLDQPVFSGFSKKTQYDISALGLDIARLSEHEIRQDLVLEVKKAYFELLQKKKLEKVARQAVIQLTAQREVSRNFYEVGMAPKNDFLQSEVELANAKQGLVVAKNDVELARSRFNTLLRRPVDAPLTVEDVLTYEPFSLSYEGCVETALQQRTEMQIADLEVETAGREVKLIQANYYPSIDLRANYYKRGDDPSLDGGEGIFFDEEWDVVATASWTFWEWGKTRYGAEEKLRRLSQARLKRIEVEDNIRQEVKGAYLVVKAAENAILTVQKAVEQAEENFRMNEERYKEQVATSTDVLDAQTLLTQTQTNYFNALSVFNISKAALHRAMGLEIVTEP
ncbi:MAG: TolC family protein [Desulfobacterales bacterium]|nr:MAG: TolC family protein [Desulfobacterales bacterium]UCG81117.1 MAG: TolC family protein [Desulfobacterales bacterium]